VEERCQACRIYGGPEEPCQSARALVEIKKRTGRPCPRVVLEPENYAAARLVGFLIPEDTRGLAPALYDAIAEDLTAEERLSLLMRVSGALHDPKVNAKRFPKPDEPSSRRTPR
jgi:hypothetical protein